MTAAVPASQKLNFRVRPEVETRLRAAAAALGVNLTDFVIGAADERAAEVLRQRTVVPPDYFDQLQAALEAPAVASAKLREVVSRPRVFKQA